ncbi:MAG: tetratricopeptide repeat protein, partial [Candidatus Aminicenantes bacterium]|nr:tetratricopeptide repeat protein [Candidatus Aminicenantes bacterium]
MYFKNNTGDEELGHWRSALSQWLITDLTQSRFINVLPVDKLFSILRKLNLMEAQSYASEDLKKVAVEGGVNHIFQASLSKAGDTFRIDYSLQRADTLEIIGSDYVKGEGEESFPTMVDDLTKKIKADLKLSKEVIASDSDKEVGKITTSSPEAYRYYREGMEYFAKGDFIKSLPLMEMAVALDPEFAMAYRNMALAYTYIGYRSEALERLQKAFELSDKVSDRERYYIHGVYYLQSENTYDKAIEAYTELLKVYPDDSIGNNNLGALYAMLEEWDKAIPFYEVNIQNRDENIFSYENIAFCYAAKGQYGKAREALELYLRNISDNVIVRFDTAENYLHQGKYDPAQVEVEKGSVLDPGHYRNFLLKGDIHYYQGDFIKAEQEYQKLLETDEPRAHAEGMTRLYALYLLQGKLEKAKEQAQLGMDLGDMFGEAEWSSRFHSYMAYLNLESKDFDSALKECEEAWNTASEGGILHRQRETLFLKGLIYTEMNRWDEAQATASELKKLIDEGMNRKAERMHYHLMGRMELEKKSYSRAVELFNQGLTLLPFQVDLQSKQALFIEPLAFAHFQ